MDNVTISYGPYHMARQTAAIFDLTPAISIRAKSLNTVDRIFLENIFEISFLKRF